MRIIAGSFKGRKLVSPRGAETRPTSDRVREAIFSVVGEMVRGASVLDLYSGTGAMGLEALSRGAKKTVFVEKGQAALKCLKMNIEAAGCQERAQVVKGSVLTFLKKDDRNADFDLVFADPPYAGNLGTLTLLAISKHVKPLKRCLIVLEHAPDKQPEPLPANLERVDTRKYGNVAVTFLEFKNMRGSD